MLGSLSARRAWIEIANRYKAVIDVPSLSARRAWIEILLCLAPLPWGKVALRKESVDRNICSRIFVLTYIVALRKESVDRNASSSNMLCSVESRSPQGERG